jgi:hypothetical protein
MIFVRPREKETNAIMPSEKLSTKQRAALFALLAEAREVSNPQLRERFGFVLDGKDRHRLNELKLVDSHKAGRSYIHELTDAGWRWCHDELFGEPPAGSGTLTRATYGVLALVGGYLDRAGVSLADVAAANGAGAAREENAGGADVEAGIVAAYRVLAGEPGEFVRLAALRGRLGDISRTDTDEALAAMYRARRINLIPQSDQLTLTADDRESALRIGGEHKHLISIER